MWWKRGWVQALQLSISLLTYQYNTHLFISTFNIYLDPLFSRPPSESILKKLWGINITAFLLKSEMIEVKVKL